MPSTRDKIEFAVAMGQNTSATVRDILALIRYASAYQHTPLAAHRDKVMKRMNEVCARLNAGIKPTFGGVSVVVGQTEIRIPV